MAKCVRCGAETSLYVNRTPLCLECDGKRGNEIQEQRKPVAKEEAQDRKRTERFPSGAK
jgi:hypothetical protein